MSEVESVSPDSLLVENHGPRPEIRYMSDGDAGAAISSMMTEAADRKRDPRTGRFMPTAAPDDRPANETDGAPDASADAGEETPPPAPKAKEKAKAPPSPTENAETDDTAEPTDDAEDGVRYDPTQHGKMLVPIKVNGIEEWHPIEEVRAGYSRTGDYTQKTQALAEERKRFEAEEVTPIRAEREQLRQYLTQLESIVQAAMPDREPDWERLQRDVTPEEFQAQFVNWRKNSERLQRVREQQSAVQARLEADAQRQLDAHLATEYEKLQQAIPEFRDADQGKQLRDDLVAYAKSLGYTSDDLAQITDHRLLVVLNKARLHEQAQNRRTTVETKVDRALDKGLKPSGVRPPAAPNKVETARAKLAQSGSIDDAADAIGALLGVG